MSGIPLLINGLEGLAAALKVAQDELWTERSVIEAQMLAVEMTGADSARIEQLANAIRIEAQVLAGLSRRAADLADKVGNQRDKLLPLTKRS